MEHGDAERAVRDEDVSRTRFPFNAAKITNQNISENLFWLLLLLSIIIIVIVVI